MNGEFILYVDFDSTLFNTKMFIESLVGLIAEESGLSAEKVKAESKGHYMHPVLGGYLYESHMSSYGLDPEVMWSRLESITHNKDFLYEDSVSFIQSQQAAGHDPKIPSFGEPRFQMAKISPMLPLLTGSSDPNAIDVIIVDVHKNEYISKKHAGKRGALVDDVLDQQLPEGFTEINIDRSRQLPEPLAQMGGFTVSDLQQAEQVIGSVAYNSTYAERTT